MIQTLRNRLTVERVWWHAPRLLLGLLFLLPGTIKLVVPFDIVGPNYGAGEPFMTSLRDTGYLFTLLALTQVTAGLLLLSNRFVPLALVLLAPIIVNIFLFHLFIEPSLQGWFMTALVVGLELLLVTRYRHVFTPLFQAKETP